MNHTKPTRTTILTAAFTSALMLGAVGLRVLRPVSTSVVDPALEALKTQRAELNEFNGLALNRANETRAAAEGRLWSTEKINQWRSSVPEGWRVQEVANIPAVFTTQRRFLVSHPAAAFRDWPAIVAFISDTAGRPALRIHSLTITAPPGAKRNFTQLQLLVGLAAIKPSPSASVADLAR